MSVESTQKDKSDQYYFDDEKEFYAKFLFNPQFKGYEHITKDLAVTNLRSRYKEPEIVRLIMRSFNILNKKTYFFENKDFGIIGYEEKEVKNDDGEIVKLRTPVLQEMTVLKSKYPKTHSFLLGKLTGIISTSQARDGHLLRGFNTRHIQREETIEDKTYNKPGFMGLFGQKKSSVGGNQKSY